MRPIAEDIPGATPIDDLSGLIPTHLTTRSELNEWEAANILKAARKYLGAKKLWAYDTAWLKMVHKDMFDETWGWAGRFRENPLNIGIDWHNIPEQIKLLADDLAYWQKGKNFDIFEQSVRLHHRLVKVHAFINGNGRHARLVSDIYLFNHDHKLPLWPDKKLIIKGNIREKYVRTLQAADKGDYKLLEEFTKKLIK